jgi:hypothetical protein
MENNTEPKSMKTSTALMILFGGGQVVAGIFKGYIDWSGLGITLAFIYAIGRVAND